MAEENNGGRASGNPSCRAARKEKRDLGLQRREGGSGPHLQLQVSSSSPSPVRERGDLPALLVPIWGGLTSPLVQTRLRWHGASQAWGGKVNCDSAPTGDSSAATGVTPQMWSPGATVTGSAICGVTQPCNDGKTNTGSGG